MGKRITIITAGHVSACPRMLKAADALVCSGHTVRVVSVSHTGWSMVADARIFETRKWTPAVVDYSAATGGSLRVKSGLRLKAMGALASAIGPLRAPMSVVTRAFSRVHDELVARATAGGADLIYGGSNGALAAVADAAERLGVPFGVDFEDLHSAEHEGSGTARNGLAARIERRVIKTAAFTTAGSPMIADAYHERYGIRPLPIHNTFSISPAAIKERGAGSLRLYWFSQTLGPQRGIEHIVRAAGEANVPVELHLRARPVPAFLEALRRVHAYVAPLLELVLHDPIDPDSLIASATDFDAGLATEDLEPLNRRLALSNKAFTYLAAGVPVLISRTPAQARLEADLGAAAFGFECGDVSAIARILRELAADAGLRRRSREAARDAAARRWHWEHPEDRGALVAAVERAL